MAGISLGNAGSVESEVPSGQSERSALEDLRWEQLRKQAARKKLDDELAELAAKIGELQGQTEVINEQLMGSPKIDAATTLEPPSPEFPDTSLPPPSSMPPKSANIADPGAAEAKGLRDAALSRYESFARSQEDVLKRARQKLSLTTVQWRLGDGRDCNEVCESTGTKCDVNELGKLSSETAVNAAVREAGANCNRFELIGVGGEWDGPWKTGGNCGYDSNPQWRPTCRNKPNKGFERICPCVSNAGRNARPTDFIVPSLQLNKDMLEEVSMHGSKYIIANSNLIQTLGQRCVVYSMQRGGSMEYANHLSDLGCAVHMFDCTKAGPLNLREMANSRSGVHSHSLCIGELTNPKAPHVYTLDELQRIGGHAAVDALRISLDGRELDFIESFLAGGQGMTLAYQISLSLHVETAKDHMRLGSIFRRLDQKGYRVVSKVDHAGYSEILMVATQWPRADSLVPSAARPAVEALASKLDAPAADGTGGYQFSNYELGREAARFGQDKWVDSVLRRSKGLFVLESDAGNGEAPSDSLLLETKRGWKCLLVQPEPSKHREILSRQRGCHVWGGSMKDHPMHQLVWALQRKTVDYWSVHTHGSELEVIKVADFKAIEVGVVSVHHGWDGEKREDINFIMHKKGLTRVHNFEEVDMYANPAYFHGRDLAFPRAPENLVPLDQFHQPLWNHFKEFDKKLHRPWKSGYTGPKFLPEAERVHDCSKGVAPGPIPHIFHTVTIIERAAWINKSNPSRLILRRSREFQKNTPYEQLLIENIRHTVWFNEFEYVHYLDDTACLKLLRKWSEELERIFRQEGDLRYKADICRVAALYYEGGYYFDDDMISYRPVVPMIHEKTDFASAIGVTEKDFFQSFMAVVPCHPVLRRNMEMLAEVKKPGFNWVREMIGYDILLGPATLRKSYDLVKKKGQVSSPQLLKEVNAGGEKENWMHCGYVVRDPETKAVVFCSRF